MSRSRPWDDVDWPDGTRIDHTYTADPWPHASEGVTVVAPGSTPMTPRVEKWTREDGGEWEHKVITTGQS